MFNPTLPRIADWADLQWPGDEQAHFRAELSDLTNNILARAQKELSFWLDFRGAFFPGEYGYDKIEEEVRLHEKLVSRIDVRIRSFQRHIVSLHHIGH